MIQNTNKKIVIYKYALNFGSGNLFTHFDGGFIRHADQHLTKYTAPWSSMIDLLDFDFIIPCESLGPDLNRETCSSTIFHLHLFKMSKGRRDYDGESKLLNEHKVVAKELYNSVVFKNDTNNLIPAL